jgi:hypothetical protein
VTVELRNLPFDPMRTRVRHWRIDGERSNAYDEDVLAGRERGERLHDVGLDGRGEEDRVTGVRLEKVLIARVERQVWELPAPLVEDGRVTITNGAEGDLFRKSAEGVPVGTAAAAADDGGAERTCHRWSAVTRALWIAHGAHGVVPHWLTLRLSAHQPPIHSDALLCHGYDARLPRL